MAGLLDLINSNGAMVSMSPETKSGGSMGNMGGHMRDMNALPWNKVGGGPQLPIGGAPVINFDPSQLERLPAQVGQGFELSPNPAQPLLPGNPGVQNLGPYPVNPQGERPQFIGRPYTLGPVPEAELPQVVIVPRQSPFFRFPEFMPALG